MLSIYNTKDHRWRDAYNPLRGLGMPKLVSLLEAGERGQYADLQWLYHYMERSDAMIASVLQRRRAALLLRLVEVLRLAREVNAQRLRRTGQGGGERQDQQHVAERAHSSLGWTSIPSR